MPRKKKNPHAVALGRKGGLKGGPARAKRLSSQQRSESARNAVLTRWGRAKDHPAGEFVAGESAAERRRFLSLVDKWREERGATSSITVAAMKPSYQQIIGMGAKAIPLIFEQLKSEADKPDQWFWALKMITGADPVPEQDRGNFRKMAAAWTIWYESLSDAR